MRLFGISSMQGLVLWIRPSSWLCFGVLGASTKKYTTVLDSTFVVLVHPNNEYARRYSNRRCLNVDEKICIALRVAGGATAVDAAWGFGVSRTTVKGVFLKFIIALTRSSMGRIAYPTSQAELQTVADGFQAQTYGDKAQYYHGCGGAGDGLAVHIKAVSLRECPNPLAYINRKGFYSLNLQSIKDSKMRFLYYVNLETQGATHDSTAFFATEFSEQFLDRNRTRR